MARVSNSKQNKITTLVSTLYSFVAMLICIILASLPVYWPDANDLYVAGQLCIPMIMFFVVAFILGIIDLAISKNKNGIFIPRNIMLIIGGFFTLLVATKYIDCTLDDSLYIYGERVYNGVAFGKWMIFFAITLIGGAIAGLAICGAGNKNNYGNPVDRSFEESTDEIDRLARKAYGSNSANRSSRNKMSDDDVADKLRKYKSLLDEGLITEEEYNQKKKEIL